MRELLVLPLTPIPERCVASIRCDASVTDTYAAYTLHKSNSNSMRFPLC